MIESLNCRIDCTTREVCKFVLGFKYLAEFLGLSTLTIHVQRKCLNFHLNSSNGTLIVFPPCVSWGRWREAISYGIFLSIGIENMFYKAILVQFKGNYWKRNDVFAISSASPLGRGFLTNPHHRDRQDDKCPGGGMGTLWIDWAGSFYKIKVWMPNFAGHFAHCCVVICLA